VKQIGTKCPLQQNVTFPTHCLNIPEKRWPEVFNFGKNVHISLQKTNSVFNSILSWGRDPANTVCSQTIYN